MALQVLCSAFHLALICGCLCGCLYVVYLLHTFGVFSAFCCLGCCLGFLETLMWVLLCGFGVVYTYDSLVRLVFAL